jgi:hypothetical protein
MKDQIPDTPAPQVLDSSAQEPTAVTSHSEEQAASEAQTEVPTTIKVEERPQEALVSQPSPQSPTETTPDSADVRPAPPHEAQPAPTPTVPAPRVHVHHPPHDQRQAPMWIDALIVVGLAVLVTMLYRKIGNSSNLIETVSL